MSGVDLSISLYLRVSASRSVSVTEQSTYLHLMRLRADQSNTFKTSRLLLPADWMVV